MLGYEGRGYLGGLKPAEVRDSALGVSPPPPLRKYNYLTEVVVFCCNRNVSMGTGMRGGYGGGCYLNDLTLSGVGSSALKLCASVPSEKGSTSKIDCKVLVRPETALFVFS